MISDLDLQFIREKIEDRISPKRYEHIIGVEKMALKLGRVLLPEQVKELQVAALLHDLTKEASLEEHLDLAERFDIVFSKDDLNAPQILHSLTAQCVAKTDFSEFLTDDIISAITKHTLGGDEMSAFDEIIFISDFIEEGRKYESSVKTREFLLKSIENCSSRTEGLRYLHKACVLSIDCTVEHLTEKGFFLHPQIIKTKNALLALL